MDEAYPFPKRTGGHPNFSALVDRLFTEHTQARLAGRTDTTPNLTIIGWDTDHTSPIIKETFSAKDVHGHTFMDTLRSHAAAFIDEGVKSENDEFARLVSGKMTEKELSSATARVYNMGDVALRDRTNDAYAQLWRSARDAGQELFHPENRPLRSKAMGPLPTAEKLRAIDSALQNASGRACSKVISDAFISALPADLQTQLDQSYKHLMQWRTGLGMNDDAAFEATEYQQGRHGFVHYGASHGMLQDIMKKDSDVVGITMITSERTPWTLSQQHRLGSYVYFAAEDKVVNVPTDAKERAAFIERLKNPPNAHRPQAKTPEEKAACFINVAGNEAATEYIGNNLLLLSGATNRTRQQIEAATGQSFSDEAVGRMFMDMLVQEQKQPGSSGLTDAINMLKKSGVTAVESSGETEQTVTGSSPSVWHHAPDTPNTKAHPKEETSPAARGR